MKTWIMVANASEGLLYQTDNLRGGDIILLREFSHPKSREKGRELLTDRPGHFSTSHTARGTFEKLEPKELEADNFSRELTEVLHHGYNDHAFAQLVLITAPHFYGLINKHFNHLKFNFENIIHIPKDYTKLSAKDLLAKIHNHLYSK